MDDCLFCKIVKGEIPSTKVYEDELCYAFRDINPQAPVHVVLVPKKHVSGMNEVDGLTDAEIAGLLRAVKKIAAREQRLSVGSASAYSYFGRRSDGRQNVVKGKKHTKQINQV